MILLPMVLLMSLEIEIFVELTIIINAFRFCVTNNLTIVKSIKYVRIDQLPMLEALRFPRGPSCFLFFSSVSAKTRRLLVRSLVGASPYPHALCS